MSGQFSSFFILGLILKATGLAHVILTCSSRIAGFGRVADARFPTRRFKVDSPSSWQVTRKTWRSFLYRYGSRIGLMLNTLVSAALSVE